MWVFYRKFILISKDVNTNWNSGHLPIVYRRKNIPRKEIDRSSNKLSLTFDLLNNNLCMNYRFINAPFCKPSLKYALFFLHVHFCWDGGSISYFPVDRHPRRERGQQEKLLFRRASLPVWWSFLCCTGSLLLAKQWSINAGRRSESCLFVKNANICSQT